MFNALACMYVHTSHTFATKPQLGTLERKDRERNVQARNHYNGENPPPINFIACGPKLTVRHLDFLLSALDS